MGLTAQQMGKLAGDHDPRVMATILPSCGVAQLRDMFGPVSRYVIERDGVAAGVARSALGGELMQELFAA
jgi:hypothetical protein